MHPSHLARGQVHALNNAQLRPPGTQRHKRNVLIVRDGGAAVVDEAPLIVHGRTPQHLVHRQPQQTRRCRVCLDDLAVGVHHADALAEVLEDDAITLANPGQLGFELEPPVLLFNHRPRFDVRSHQPGRPLHVADLGLAPFARPLVGEVDVSDNRAFEFHRLRNKCPNARARRMNALMVEARQGCGIGNDGRAFAHQAQGVVASLKVDFAALAIVHAADPLAASLHQHDDRDRRTAQHRHMVDYVLEELLPALDHQTLLHRHPTNEDSSFAINIGPDP